MILLVAGASETGLLAQALLSRGHRVLASMATGAEIILPSAERFELRRGRLDREGFEELIRGRGVEAVVDASHPFAVALRRELAAACESARVPRTRYERPASGLSGPHVEDASDHEDAAERAFAAGLPVLLTTGSRNLSSYAELARRFGIPLYARVLPEEESRRACREAGLPDERIVFARGPFSVAENLEILSRWKIGVLVAKDAGEASGLAERIKAADLAGARVVLVRRPRPEPGACSRIEELLERMPPALEADRGRDLSWEARHRERA